MVRAREQLGYQLTWNTAVGSASGYPLNWPMVGLAGLLLAGGTAGTFRILRPPAGLPPPLPGDETLTPSERRLQGLGGWLVLVGIGVLLRPFVYAVSLFQGHQAYFNQAVWAALTTPGTGTYRPLFSLLAPMELALNVLLLVFGVAIALLYLRKSRHFPGLIQLLLVLEILATAFAAWSSFALGPVTEAEKSQVIGEVIRALIVAAIWIPYFRISRRVALTFIH